MTLIERGADLTHLRHLLDDCIAGSGAIVAIDGPVASGKTKLLQTFMSNAAAVGVRVLAATCSQSERDLPLGAVAQMLHAAYEPINSCSAVTRLIDDGPLDPATWDSRPGQAVQHVDPRIVHGLCISLLDLARQSPILIAVDDVHDADPGSRQFLLALARRTQSARILVKAGVVPKGATQTVRAAWQAVGVV